MNLSLGLMLLAVSAAGPQPKITVLDFQVAGARPELAAAAAGMVGSELSRLGVFRVLTADSARALVGLEKQQALVGANNTAELGTILGTDYAVNGKISKLAAEKGAVGGYTLELNLLNVEKGRRDSTDLETAKTEAELLSLVPKAVVKLMGKLLSSRSGTLLVESSESGGTVKLDDVVVGTTPMPGALPVPGGPHFLAVEKEGFVGFQKEIRIQPEQVTVERAALLPSADFIRAYETKANRMRVGAWIGTGLAVVGVMASAGLQLKAGQLYGDVATPGTFQYARAKLNAGVESDASGDYRASANTLKASIGSLETMSYVGLGVAAAAAVAGGYFWVAGDPPERYSTFKMVGVTAAPTPGGAAVSVGGTF